MKEEEVQLSEYISLEQAYDSIRDYIFIYNTMRISPSLRIQSACRGLPTTGRHPLRNRCYPSNIFGLLHA